MITSLDQVTESRLTWPEKQPRTAYRSYGPFKTEVQKATSEIENELPRWGIKQWIISRNNQRIFAGDPGVAVWWNHPPKKPGGAVELRVLACDRYDSVAKNLHAIYLTLDAMRALNRWGAYTLEQAIEGAKLALPAPEGADTINWRAVFGDVPAGLAAIDALAVVNGRYRRKAAEANGDDSELRRLNLAVELARKELAP